jgi:hypothetical protein
VISWRYHLVSIVAVFLALGLGILVGTTVLDDSLVRSLQGRTERLQIQLDDLRGEVVAAQADAGGLETYAKDVQPFATANQLAGTPVVLVTADGVDDGSLGETRSSLDMAGASVVTTLTVQPSMLATDPSDRQDLAVVLDLPPDTPADQMAADAANELAQRLATPPVRADGSPDVLGDLLGGGFVTAPGLSDADLPDVGGTGQVVVVVGGGSTGAVAIGDAFLTPLVARLTGAGVDTAAAEGSDPSTTFVSATRDATDSGALVTVDGVDQSPGGTSLVLGVAHLLGSGEGGTYGAVAGGGWQLPPPPT